MKYYNKLYNHFLLEQSGTTHLVFFISRGRRYGKDRVSVTSSSPGLQRVQLLRSLLPDPELPEDTRTFVIHVDDVSFNVVIIFEDFQSRTI